jgi:hypothetical protein
MSFKMSAVQNALICRNLLTFCSDSYKLCPWFADQSLMLCGLYLGHKDLSGQLADGQFLNKMSCLAVCVFVQTFAQASAS